MIQGIAGISKKNPPRLNRFCIQSLASKEKSSLSAKVLNTIEYYSGNNE
jgi:hypothetical protein